MNLTGPARPCFFAVFVELAGIFEYAGNSGIFSPDSHIRQAA
jgi:hypothetical protein